MTYKGHMKGRAPQGDNMTTEIKLKDVCNILHDLRPLSEEEFEVIKKFKHIMEDEVIPQVIKEIDERNRLAVESRKRILTEKIPPVDRLAQTLTDGSPVTDDHREINPETGQQKGYVVLSEEERKKGFVRPVRQVYTHKRCGADTRMGLALAETYARDPSFYSGTFCSYCKTHFPLSEFTWKGTICQVGS